MKKNSKITAEKQRDSGKGKRPPEKIEPEIEVLHAAGVAGKDEENPELDLLDEDSLATGAVLDLEDRKSVV